MIKRWLQERSSRVQQEREHDVLYDDSSKTPWQKARSKMKEYWNTTKWPLALLAVAGVLRGTGEMSQAPVVPLQWHDFNNDGVEDAVVVFPIKGTKKGLLGYLDGKSIASQAQAPGRSPQNPCRFQMDPIPIINGSLFNFTSLDMNPVPSTYNSKGAARFTYISAPQPHGQYWAIRPNEKGTNEWREITKELDPQSTYLILSPDQFGVDSIIGKVK
jgi:hypothetical protein